MYRCSHCGGTMSVPLDRCPSCGVLLSGVKCENCGYIGGKSEFINNNHHCPKCNSAVHVPGVYIPRATRSSRPITRATSNKSVTIPASNKSPTIAALLSFFFLGGGGQIYLGQWAKGLTLVLATLFLSGVFIGIPIGIIGIGDAYGTAQKLSNGNSVGKWEFNINWKVVGLVAIIYVIIIGGLVLLASLNPSK